MPEVVALQIETLGGLRLKIVIGGTQPFDHWHRLFAVEPVAQEIERGISGAALKVIQGSTSDENRTLRTSGNTSSLFSSQMTEQSKCSRNPGRVGLHPGRGGGVAHAEMSWSLRWRLADS